MKLVYFTLICAFAVLIAFSTRRVAAAPPLQCSPGFQQDEDLPLKLREVCDALSTFYELSNAMEAYVDEKVASDINNPPRVVGQKRKEDSQHLFLRFGRRH